MYFLFKNWWSWCYGQFDCIYRSVISKWEFFNKMRAAYFLSPSFVTWGRMGASRAALILMKNSHFDRTLQYLCLWTFVRKRKQGKTKHKQGTQFAFKPILKGGRVAWEMFSEHFCKTLCRSSILKTIRLDLCSSQHFFDWRRLQIQTFPIRLEMYPIYIQFCCQMVERAWK